MRLGDREDLVTVLTTKDPAVIAIAKSILDGAGIQYSARGETANTLFGGALVGFNGAASLVQIQVLQDIADDALELLKDLSASDPGEQT
jgi:hypothetical protein